MSLVHSIPKSFSYAIQGLKKALSEEPNFRIHLVLGITACIAAFLLGFSALEWLILTVTIFFVLIQELINTSLENIVDLITPEIKNEAKVAKDADWLECALQAREYLDSGAKDAEDWLERIGERLKTKSAKEIFAHVRKNPSHVWWKGLKKV